MAKIKKKEHEKLDDANIKSVIGLLEKGITKKEACNILNISYNTIRLKNIINEYEEKVAFRKIRKSQNKGKPATQIEIKEIIEQFLEGEPISLIASRLYRSTSLVNGVINKVGLPRKPKSEDISIPSIIPDQCISETFEPGEIVWSAIYHKPGEVIEEIKGDYEKLHGSKCYKVYIIEKSENEPPFFVEIGGYYIYSAAYNLGSLKHLEKFGVKIC